MSHQVSAGITIENKEIFKFILAPEQLCKKIIELREMLNFKSQVRIRLFSSINELQHNLGYTVPPWVIGMIQGSSIFILNPSSWLNQNLGTIEQLIVHEFCHIAFRKVMRCPFPIWIDEGLAVNLSGQIESINSNVTVQKNVYHLSYLDEELYPVAGETVKILIQQYGLGSMINLLLQVTSFMNDPIFGEKAMIQLLESN